SVAEHALWSLYRGKKGGIEASEISVDNLHARSANIRRRSYILIGKYDESFYRHIGFLRSRIYSELDVYAREGLALTLATTYRYNPEIEGLVSEWFESEEVEVVRMALLPH